MPIFKIPSTLVGSFFVIALTMLVGGCSSDKKEAAVGSGPLEGTWRLNDVQCAAGQLSNQIAFMTAYMKSGTSYLNWKIDKTTASAEMKLSQQAGNSCTATYTYTRTDVGEGKIKLTRSGSDPTFTKEGSIENCNAEGMKQYESLIGTSTWSTSVNAVELSATVEDNVTLNSTACGENGKARIQMKRL